MLTAETVGDVVKTYLCGAGMSGLGPCRYVTSKEAALSFEGGINTLRAFFQIETEKIDKEILVYARY